MGIARPLLQHEDAPDEPLLSLQYSHALNDDTDTRLVGYAGLNVTKPNHIANDVLPLAARAMATTLILSLHELLCLHERLPHLYLYQLQAKVLLDVHQRLARSAHHLSWCLCFILSQMMNVSTYSST